MARPGTPRAPRRRETIIDLTGDEPRLLRRATRLPEPIAGFARGRRAAILVLAVLTALVEGGVTLAGYPTLTVGTIPVPITAAPAMVLLGLLGGAALGRLRPTPAAAACWVATILAFVTVATVYARPTSLSGLVLAAFTEEVAYRFAIPLVIAAGLRAVRVPSVVALPTGYGLALVWFVFLPGHQAQMSSVADVLPFVAGAILFTVAVARSQAVAAAGLVHAVMNISTFAVWHGSMPLQHRSLFVTVLFALLVIAFGRREPAPASEAEPVDVDLRALEAAQA